ncbi:MAG: type II 3-dehydroquinate dehydratase [Chloroflexi bacterium]|nr:type II 3-dehydroquinate dehydratase [Chloroflexota bacterium]
MTLLVINGPNLNLLGQRDSDIYGTLTLAAIEQKIQERARELGTEVAFFQSNSEGALIDHLQQEAPGSQGVIINPGAYTHYSLALRDTLANLQVPIIEVHISNIYGREPFRHRSVIAPVVRGQISGLGWRGYLAALEYLVASREESP